MSRFIESEAAGASDDSGEEDMAEGSGFECELSQGFIVGDEESEDDAVLGHAALLHAQRGEEAARFRHDLLPRCATSTDDEMDEEEDEGTEEEEVEEGPSQVPTVLLPLVPTVSMGEKFASYATIVL